MSARTHARPGTAPLAAPVGAPVSARFGLRGAVRTIGRLLVEVTSTTVACLDGLVIGLTIAFIAAAAISGPSLYLGLPWPVEGLIAGGGASLLALAGAAAASVARAVLVGTGGVIDRWLGAAASPGRPRTFTRRVAGAAFGFIEGLPAAWLGAMAVCLWLGIAGRDVGPLGLFVPAGALSPSIYLAGAVGALLAGARNVVRDAPVRRLPLGRRAVAVVLAAAAVLVTSFGTAAALGPGTAASLVAPTVALDGIVAPSPLPDPGAAGPYEVRATSYGSGHDNRRPAFGADAAVFTPTIDASSALPALGAGADELRAWFWGFGPEALPLNGLAWLPGGNGPFPLVLMVHGNHAMGDFSSPGFEYLGRHLASRGFIAVSVDEDFLNGSWAGDWDGDEQLVRAWLLLLHLDLWRAWNETPGSAFEGLVDMERVALLGHSRGGEAATVAATLADDAAPPRAGLRPWPTGLRIQAVVAIAPSDGQYGPSTTVTGTDLLELQGGYDADVRGWVGLRQYARTTAADDVFRAAFWSYRSNHGQFNTAWGRSDHGPLGGALLNLGPILPAADQEDVAKTAIGAFLEASLHGIDGYRDLFRRPMAGREWLPADDIFLVRSSDEAFVPLTTSDPSRPIEGVDVSIGGFESRRTASLPLRALAADQAVRGLELRWDALDGAASYGLVGINAAAASANATGIRFALANGSLPGDSGSGAGGPEAMIELTTLDGVRVAMPLSRWGALPPPLAVALVKDERLASIAGINVSVAAQAERVLQSYAIPFADFVRADPAFDPAHVTGMRIVVDRTTAGCLWISEVGLDAGV